MTGLGLLQAQASIRMADSFSKGRWFFMENKNAPVNIVYITGKKVANLCEARDTLTQRIIALHVQ